MKAIKYLFMTDDSIAPLAARLALGVVFFAHGAQMALGWFGGYGYAGTVNFFAAELHIPPALTFVSIVAQFGGGIGLILGALSRLAALGVGATMLVAIFKVHIHDGFFMNWFGTQKGEGIEYHILAIGLALVVMVAGGGKWSLDRLLAGQGACRTGESTKTCIAERETIAQ
jgi:putative oxidoreductase